MALAQALVASYGDVSLWSDPSVFMDFQNTATSYIRAGTGQSDTKTTSLFSSVSGWTFARSSVAYHLNSSGNFVEASSGDPRIDHDASGTAKGLLVEGASSNVIPSSTPFIGSGSEWTVTNKVTKDANGNVATTTLLNSTFYEIEASSGGVLALNENGMQLDLQTAGTHTYTASAYIKPNSGFLNANIRVDGNDTNFAQATFHVDATTSPVEVTVGSTQFTTGGTGWTAIDSGVIDIGSGIFRIWFTFSWTYTAGSGSNAFNRLRFRGAADAGDSYYISHIQLEKTNKLTSYIRKARSGHVWNGSALDDPDTNHGTTTGNARSAETARLDLGSNGWYGGGGPTTIMATARNDDLTPSVNQAMVSLQDASDNDVRFAMFAKVGNGDKITAQFVNGSVSASFENSSAMTEGQNVTAAASFAQDGTAADVLHTQEGNTATASTKASATIPTASIDTLIFGAIGTAGDQTLNGTIRSAYVWPRALRAEQIEAFTSSTPPTDPSPGT